VRDVLTAKGFLAANLLAGRAVGLVGVYAFFVEPEWLAVRHERPPGLDGVRFAHISDIHFKGKAGYLSRMFEVLNSEKPDFSFIPVTWSKTPGSWHRLWISSLASTRRS
jgi:predicted MPP superfamily phosphohydrolase